MWGLSGIKGKGTEYYHHDGHGNVTAVTDENGAVLKSYEYDAFGVELNEDASDGNPFRYCGAYYDKETGLYYLVNRYYDPSLGRFTQKDPAKDGANWYIYCYNDPINLLDELGLKPTKEAAAAMADHIYGASMGLLDDDMYVAGWQLVDVQYGKESMKMGVYIPKGDNISAPSEYALVFRGSTFAFDYESFQVWSNNIEAKFGTSSQDMKDAMTMSNDFCNTHSDYEITMVGHSKGGGEAIAAALYNDKNAITFNAANFNFKNYGLYKKRNLAIDNYYVKGEALNKWIGVSSIGTTHWLDTQYYADYSFIDDPPAISCRLPDGLANHGMQAIKKAFGLI